MPCRDCFLLLAVAALSSCGDSTGPPGPTLVITTETLPTAQATIEYEATLAAEGGNGGYSWAVVQGSLTDGLTLDASTGRISGLPMGPASLFTVNLRSRDGQAAERTYSIAFDFQVIESVDFDPSLGIDLARMEMLPSGVYREDLVVGSGAELTAGMRAFVNFTGWFTSGAVLDNGAFDFQTGAGQVIPGFEEGMFGQRVGGTRRIIIPPASAYGSGIPGIPAGAVLIFEITLTNAI